MLMGGIAVGIAVTAIGLEVGRVWRRGSAPMPSETDSPLAAAEVAMSETVEVAVAGYQDVPSRQNALFNLLISFVSTFAIARSITYLLRSRHKFGPFRNLIVGRRHIHHFIPGIVIAFASGALAITTSNERLEPRLAIGFGIGMGLTLDESALLLELEDVYWTREGLLSVQITLAVMAFLGALVLAAGFLRRGEQIVLEEPEPPAPPPLVSPDAASG
jgi:multisubunit Na+/H+ antiporter MnhF subunit